MNVLAIGSDHAGFILKEFLIEKLKNKGFIVIDKGTFSMESVDYPDFAHKVAFAVDNGEVNKAILICGSGNGVNITANKYKNVRSALCWNEKIAELARLHNDANIIALPARFISNLSGWNIVEKFLNTAFEGGRHTRRVEKINQILR
ncbi:MAG: ribose 5-phosphate isomerase B [Lentimicrobiaceae bacterium]|nr:ribose 5-phosphate isomerase B [Lentimicrobiaceae bacterium]